MLGMLQGNRVPLISTGSLGAKRIMEKKVLEASDIDGLSTAAQEIGQVLIWSYHDNILPKPEAPIWLTIKAPSGVKSKAWVVHFRIDATHSNAFTRWLEMGSPESPTSAQLAELNKASELTMQEGISYQDVKDDNCSWNLT